MVSLDFSEKDNPPRLDQPYINRIEAELFFWINELEKELAGNGNIFKYSLENLQKTVDNKVLQLKKAQGDYCIHEPKIECIELVRPLVVPETKLHEIQHLKVKSPDHEESTTLCQVLDFESKQDSFEKAELDEMLHQIAEFESKQDSPGKAEQVEMLHLIPDFESTQDSSGKAELVEMLHQITDFETKQASSENTELVEMLRQIAEFESKQDSSEKAENISIIDDIKKADFKQVKQRQLQKQQIAGKMDLLSKKITETSSGGKLQNLIHEFEKLKFQLDIVDNEPLILEMMNDHGIDYETAYENLKACLRS
jgi:hypothetical protein